MNEEPKNIKSIFAEALEKKAPQERAAYLDEACGSDKKSRVEVEALLKSHDRAGSFLDAPAFDVTVTFDKSPLTEGPGTVIGPYKLLEKIGEGGMAYVYMAEQEKPIRRKVALKIIKLGMDTRQVIARFEVERQALAMMDHPNIAKVFDAGATETGRPYFVMELVTGVSITEYCDKKRLSTQERLKLFTQVCNAVQHAHQKGIIHRDVKPSNVMITLHDGKPVPKVIDFGIAKATNQRLTEKTVFTKYAHMIGTPAYMSPEQAEMSGLDVDTRTDIYSLGVLLYELLTGTTPISEEELREAGLVEMQRIIREDEPAKPSTKLTTLGERLIEVAENRGAGADALRRIVRGDLDWIVMKSLEKDRKRRYDTVAELAADVERHLRYEPVTAVAPSSLYVLGKFLKRHRIEVAITFLTMISVVAIVLSLTMYVTFKEKLYHLLGTFPPSSQGNIPKNLGPIVNSAYRDIGQAISADGLELVFTSTRPNGLGGYDLWVTRRSTVSDSWNAPANLGGTVNSTFDEGAANISSDGLSMYFSSNRPGGSGNWDLWVTSRRTVLDPWGPAVNLGPTVNSPGDDCFPRISEDGLALYFADWEVARPGGYGGGDIWFTTRTSVSEPWSKPTNLGATVNSASYDAGPVVSKNGLVLYFSSSRPDGYGAEDIWVTRRSSISDAWGTPVNLGPTINSSSYDALPYLSADESILYFASSRYGGSGEWDLWQVGVTTPGGRLEEIPVDEKRQEGGGAPQSEKQDEP